MMAKGYNMTAAERRALGFVRALASGGQISVTDAKVTKVRKGQRSFSLSRARIDQLASDGVIAIKDNQIHPTSDTRNWIRRQLTTQDEAFSGQHRKTVTDRAGVRRNVTESPLRRLVINMGQGNKPYLLPHQIEAGERLSRLFERAQLRPRVTMAYVATNTGWAKGSANIAKDISDQGTDARRQLDGIQRALPAECVGVVIDVCGFEKGLQLVERERGWPRRSAKLVLRIGLEQLAMHFGLTPVAQGRNTGRHRTWMGAGSRPDKLG